MVSLVGLADPQIVVDLGWLMSLVAVLQESVSTDEGPGWLGPLAASPGGFGSP